MKNAKSMRKTKSDSSTTGIGFKINFRRSVPLTTTAAVTTLSVLQTDGQAQTTMNGCGLNGQQFEFGMVVEPVCPAGSSQGVLVYT